MTAFSKIRHLITVLIFTLSGTVTATAQNDLAISEAFSSYGNAKGCKMVVMKNTTFKGYRLTQYKALTYSTGFNEIADMLQKDRKKAKKIREVMDNGHVVSGYYMLPPTSKDTNRFVLFNKVSTKQRVVIYLEGELTPDDIMKICYTKRTY